MWTWLRQCSCTASRTVPCRPGPVAAGAPEHHRPGRLGAAWGLEGAQHQCRPLAHHAVHRGLQQPARQPGRRTQQTSAHTYAHAMVRGLSPGRAADNTNSGAMGLQPRWRATQPAQCGAEHLLCTWRSRASAGRAAFHTLVLQLPCCLVSMLNTQLCGGSKTPKPSCSDSSWSCVQRGLRLN